MKLFTALTAILFFTISNAQSQSLNEIEHIIRNGKSQKVAALITKFKNNKQTLRQMRFLIHILESKPLQSSVISKLNSHDIAAIILSRLTGIPLSNQKELKVKSILAHIDGSGKVFRYHIIHLEDIDKKIFREKVHKWILKNFPA